MSAANELRVKSLRGDYSVRFVDDFERVLAESPLEKSFLVIDKNVAGLYKAQLEGILARCRHVVIEAVETHKTLDYIQEVIQSLIDGNVRRDETLVAVGGGIIQDIGGFIATVLFRGVAWEFYPTTLLAQCDSCIGSKTSVNFGRMKNQLGTFYPPGRIILDVNFLKTLAPGEIVSGLGEIIKVHLMDGKSSLDYIVSRYTRDAEDAGAFRELILRSLKIKQRYIEKDEFDTDYRNLMNYGHTFGHAIETVTDYAVSHGQAVTLGMDIANYLSLRLGFLDEKTYQSMRAALLMNYPDFRLEEEHMGPFLAVLSRDKKNVGQTLTAILTRGPGGMFKTKLPMDDKLREYLNDYRTMMMSNIGKAGD